MKRYLSFIVLLALMLGIFSVGHAQVTVTIGDGTYSNYEPFNVLWGYGRSIGLYTSDQIGAIGQITSLSWNATGSSSLLVPYKIYAKLTSDALQTAGTWADFTTAATLLKEGEYTFDSAGWHTFTLDVPFVYSGGNLLIGVEANYGEDGGSGCPQFYYTTGTSGVHQQWRQDYSAPTGNGTPNGSLPNLQMTLMPLSDEPYFAISPASYNFGTILINTTGSQTFTMMNAGGGTLNVTDISPTTDGFFSITDAPALPVTLATGESATFKINYAPTEGGTHTGTFTVSDDTRATTVINVSGECHDPIISTFPWVEDFTATTFPPAEWARYQGLYPTDPLSTVTHGWSRATNFAGEAGNPSARINIYGSSRKHWLVTPPIAIPATGYQLDFDVALTAYSGGNPVNPDQQQDDRFIVLISDDPAMAGAQILREWNNTGSEYVYNGIATQGEYQMIDLSSHVGTKYIGFYGESTASGGDVYLYLDNVRVRETPTTPIFSYTPVAINFGTGFANTPTEYQNVAVSNLGGGTLNLPIANVSIIGTDAAMFELGQLTEDFVLAAGQSGNIPVRYAPTAEGAHSATLRMVCDGANYDVALSGNALGENALFEGFEGTQFPPAGWSVYNGGGAQQWQRSTTAPHTGAAHAHLRYDTVAHDDWLISPKLAPTATNHHYSFWGTNSSTYFDERFNVLVSTTDDAVASFTNTIASDVSTGAADYMYHEYDLSAFIGQHIYVAIQAISTNQLYLRIDDVTGPDIVVEAPAAPVLLAPENETTLVSIRPMLTWDAGGGGIPTGYKVYFGTDNSSLTEVADVSATQYTFTTALQPETVYYWTVEAYNSVGTSDAAEPFSFTTVPEGVFIVGNGTTANATGVYPAVYGGFYKNAREQYIITADELIAEGAEAGDFISIAFNVAAPNNCANLPNFTIKMGTTTATEFTDNNFIGGPLQEGLTQVYVAPGPYTPTAGWNTHFLDVPFNWDGTSNLVIQASFGMSDDWTQNASTYYTTTDTQKAIYYRNDSTDWDTVATGTRSYDRPNILLLNPAPVPPAAPTLVSPADGATLLPVGGFEFKWRPDYFGGGLPDYYTLFLATDPETIYDEYSWEVGTNTSFNPVLEDVDFNFAYGQRWYWTVSATNTYGEGVQDPPFSFEIEPDPTVYTYPWTENFDTLQIGEMPWSWTIIASHTGADDRGWTAATNAGHHTAPNAAVVYWHTEYPKDEWMITVPFSMQGGQAYNISFAVQGEGWEGVPENLAVYWGTEPTVASMTANPALFDNNNRSYSAWTLEEEMFVAPSTGIYYFGWHAYTPADVYYIAVDTITISEALAVDLAAMGISGDAFGNVGLPVNQHITVRNRGNDAQSNYTVYIKEAVTNNILAQEQITEPITAGENKIYTLSWTPTVLGDLSFYAEVEVAGDLELGNNITETVTIPIYANDIKVLNVGNPNTGWVSSAYPFTVRYKDFVAETVYLASEIQATSGIVEAIAYYNNYEADRITPVQIWMKNTDATDIADAWLTWDGYQLVFDGNIDCPEGDNEIMIQLNTPFSYTGGSLAIRTSKTWENETVEMHRWWVTQNPQHPDRTRYWVSNGDTELDHTNPTGGYSTYYIPNITFLMATENLVNTVDPPVVDVTVSGTDAVLNWELIPYAYSYNVYLSQDPYAFGEEPAGTVYGNGASIDSTIVDKLFFKVTSSTYRDYGRAAGQLRNPIRTEAREVEIKEPARSLSRGRTVTP